MISDAGTKRKSAALGIDKSNDVLLGLTTSYSDGSGEELIGIQLSDEQLEQLRQDIVLYQQARDKVNCQESQDKDHQSSPQIAFEPFVDRFASPNLILALDPNLVTIKYHRGFVEAVEACVPLNALRSINSETLAALGRTETEARIALNKKVQELILSMQLSTNNKP